MAPPVPPLPSPEARDHSAPSGPHTPDARRARRGEGRTRSETFLAVATVVFLIALLAATAARYGLN